jgi:hypothetical protein
MLQQVDITPTVRRIDKNIHLIDITQRIKGKIENKIDKNIHLKDNLLLLQFFKVLAGCISDQNVANVRNEGATMYTIRSSVILPYAAAAICRGTGTTPPSPTDYGLTSASALTTALSLAMLSDRSRMGLTATSNGTGSELGIRIGLYDSGGTGRYFYLSRVLKDVVNGTPISWVIDYLEPWLYNAAGQMYAIFSNTNVSLTDMSGTAFTMRKDDIALGGSVIGVSEHEITWSPGLYTIPTLLACTTTHVIDSILEYVIHYIHGYVVPSSDININTIGLYQQLYDTTGVTHNTLLAAISLPSSIALEGNKMNMIVLRIACM